MSGRIVRSPLAEQDLSEQAEYIARDSVEAALRFLDAAEKAFEQLARMPRMGAEWEFEDPRLGGVRVWRMRGFEKHLIFYRLAQDGIEVVRVLHGARDIESAFSR